MMFLVFIRGNVARAPMLRREREGADGADAVDSEAGTSFVQEQAILDGSTEDPVVVSEDGNTITFPGRVIERVNPQHRNKKSSKKEKHHPGETLPSSLLESSARVGPDDVSIQQDVVRRAGDALQQELDLFGQKALSS